jgi:Putative glucoamylase
VVLYNKWEHYCGQEYVCAGSLFTPQVSHVWIDLRGIQVIMGQLQMKAPGLMDTASMMVACDEGLLAMNESNPTGISEPQIKGEGA